DRPALRLPRPQSAIATSTGRQSLAQSPRKRRRTAAQGPGIVVDCRPDKFSRTQTIRAGSRLGYVTYGTRDHTDKPRSVPIGVTELARWSSPDTRNRRPGAAIRANHGPLAKRPAT